jgi:hypothetical protein
MEVNAVMRDGAGRFWLCTRWGMWAKGSQRFIDFRFFASFFLKKGRRKSFYHGTWTVQNHFFFNFLS